MDSHGLHRSHLPELPDPSQQRPIMRSFFFFCRGHHEKGCVFITVPFERMPLWHDENVRISTG